MEYLPQQIRDAREAAVPIFPVKTKICVQCGQFKTIRDFWDVEVEQISLRCTPCRNMLRRPTYIKTLNPKLKRRTTMDPCDYDERETKIYCLDKSGKGDDQFEESKDDSICLT
jgi:hypothetical protein